MKLSLFATLAFGVMMTILAILVRNKITEHDGADWGDRPEPPEVAKIQKEWRVALATAMVLLAVILFFTTDNWQTIVMLVLLSGILPVLVKDIKTGTFYIVVVTIVTSVIWQLPSTTARSEKKVGEVVKIAILSGPDGLVDTAVIEDHGQFIFYKENTDGGITQETIPATVVNGEYIDETSTSIVIYHYVDTYKRSFWSKERTEFEKRKLRNVDLCVKRGQLLNTF
ncbi:hypothetical protein IKF27_00315 [Candidatus Saccharibacteria bacterium]|nr:hypothetical protein [Candidatus Saccharibacteria bacterium]